MESPDALFAPDYLVETPVPAPLYLLSCLRLPLVSVYPVGENGTVAPHHSFQRQAIVYPDGSRFVAELSASPALGMPTIYDLDYLLGALRLGDERGTEPDGALPGISYADVIRATRGETASNAPSKIEGVKRAFQRWGNSVLRTTLEMDFAEAARAMAEGTRHPAVPAGSPVRRERDATYWILSYDWETEQLAARSRDTIRSLKLNPAWRSQTEMGLAAWIDVDAHNALPSPVAKGIHLKLVLAAAQGQLPRTHVAPLAAWVDDLGVQSREDGNKIAGRFRDAVDALVKANILRAGEVRSPRRGMYEVAIEPGSLPRYATTARGIGSMDPVRTRVLLWHLGQLGMTSAEGRALVAKHGMDVERVLRRVHYERAIKGGVDAHGREITHWSLWVAKALKREWRFDEPEYLAWIERQSARFAPSLPSPRETTRVATGTGEPAPSPLQAPAPVELPTDDVWGLTVREMRDEIGEVQLRTWFASSWLDELGEDAVRVGTSNAFAADWIRSRWGERLEELLSARIGHPMRLVIVHQSAGPALP
ncbi:MAG TPA: DnaA N-terminal domain-containing protein [Longimicrobium sp.]|nr:DnaA N-terminal domain-containing protein [Longimicrobium sp.]